MPSATSPYPRWRCKEAVPRTDTGFPATLARRSRTLLTGLSLTMAWPLIANGFECKLGEKVVAGLGDGVTMRSCSWEKSPGTFVRTGPLQLIKNGVLILQLQTDEAGRLQGQYTAWDDAGVIVEQGVYRNGLKQGEWQITDDSGKRKILHFRDGEPLDS